MIAVIVFLAVFIGYLIYASYSIKAGIYVKSFCENKNAINQVALSFDDGVDSENTPKVLEILKKHNIKAIFFVIGSKAEQNQALVTAIHSDGHLLGLHSYEHSPKLTYCSTDYLFNDIDKNIEVIKTAIGEEPIYYRPPYGVTNPHIAKMVFNKSLKSIGWNIRSFDTCKDKKYVLNKIDKKLKSGSVILLHDNLSTTVDMLEEIVELIKNKNFNIVRLDKLIKQ